MDVRTVLKGLKRTDRATHDAIREVAPGRIARVRRGVLFHTAGFTVTAGGLPNQTQMRLYSTGIGTADQGSGVVQTAALTNLLAPHKVESSKAFVGLSMGFNWWYFTRIAVAVAVQEVQDNYILDIADRTGFSLSITADQQRLGPSKLWAGPALTVQGALGNLAGGAQGAANRVVQSGGGRLDRSIALHEPYSIGPNTTLQVNGDIAPVPPAAVPMAGAVVMCTHAFFGYEIDAVSG